jgi:hypothetical protein
LVKSKNRAITKNVIGKRLTKAGDKKVENIKVVILLKSNFGTMVWLKDYKLGVSFFAV